MLKKKKMLRLIPKVIILKLALLEISKEAPFFCAVFENVFKNIINLVCITQEL